MGQSGSPLLPEGLPDPRARRCQGQGAAEGSRRLTAGVRRFHGAEGRGNRSGRIDPDGNSYVFLKTGAPQNYSAWSNAEADKALDDARLVTDLAQRKAIYEKLAKAELDEQALLYLYHRRILIAHTTKLEGYKQMPDGLVRVIGLKLK